jgi:imidazolonepropionase-like amidohydrolase
VTPGLSLWRELALLAAAGMSPEAALTTATAAPADFLGQPHWGRLTPRAHADMVVVRGDLTQALPVEPEIVSVIRAGVVHDPADLLARAEPLAATAADDPWGRQLC